MGGGDAGLEEGRELLFPEEEDRLLKLEEWELEWEEKLECEEWEE